ncbi:hypothetical protein WJX79_001711 [Trebouxia sp. C0005]
MNDEADRWLARYAVMPAARRCCTSTCFASKSTRDNLKHLKLTSALPNIEDTGRSPSHRARVKSAPGARAVGVCSCSF